jgi:cytochrome subunit of sulfide dehydrogenase
MPTPRSILRAIVIGLFIVSANQGMAADNERAAQLAAMCASCHRLDGRDKAIPPIVGMDKQRFSEAMAAFKSGTRSSSIMHAVALQFSDAEIALLADYLATRPKESKRP